MLGFQQGLPKCKSIAEFIYKMVNQIKTLSTKQIRKKESCQEAH